MSFVEMFDSIGFIGFGVLGCLVVLSLYSVSLIIDKYRRFRAAANQSVAFLPELDRCLKQGSLREAVSCAGRHGGSPVARVVAAGAVELIEYDPAAGNAQDRVEIVSRALDRAGQRVLAEMKRGLGGLATIGSMAPFIGLFGTVVGIIHAFQGIAATGSGGIAAVSAGIAEALIATALGILVAMPAVTAFNYFTGRLEQFQVELDSTSAELVDFLSKQELAVHANR